MLDPFPQEDFLSGPQDYYTPAFVKPTYPRENVYDDHKYFEEGTPFVLYKPRKDLLFKMMRMCVNVHSDQKLW